MPTPRRRRQPRRGLVTGYLDPVECDSDAGCFFFPIVDRALCACVNGTDADCLANSVLLIDWSACGIERYVVTERILHISWVPL